MNAMLRKTICSLLLWLPLAVAVSAQVRNGGFEEGLAGWEVQDAKVGAEDDLTAPEGHRVLHFSHQRTRSSSVQTRAELDPWSYYLCSLEVRGGPYVRSGLGLILRPWDYRFADSDLGEDWQTLRFAVATGADGTVPISVALDQAAGEVWLDNLRVTKCSREDLVRAFGSDTPSGLPLLGLRSANTAEASVWHDEIPVSARLPSQVWFLLRQNLGEEAWKATGRFCLELPAACRLLQDEARMTETPEGNRRTYALTAFQGGFLDLSLDKPLGEDRKARFWAEWDGGRQAPVELELSEITVPIVKAPREIVTGTVVYGHTMKPHADYPSAIRSLGFNHLDSWGSGISAERMSSLGIGVSAIAPCPGEYISLAKGDPEARSTALAGTPAEIPCLASRGRVYRTFLADIGNLAAAGHGVAGLMFDDESFCDWNGMDGCVCDRCRAAWRDWLARNRPGLAYLEPAAAIDDPLGQPDQYRAWWQFRAGQLTDWYRDMATAFRTAAAAQRPAGGPAPCLAIQAGTPSFDSLKTARLDLVALADIFDLICPQYYGGADRVARWTRELVDAVGRDKACPTLCLGERFLWQPGEFRAQILEAVFAGARGYTSWGWPYSNLRIIAEAAGTNGVLAEQETLLRQGVRTTSFRTEQPGARVAVIETEGAGLVLVSNSSRNGATQVVVRRRAGAAMELRELFTGVTARLAVAESEFAPAVPPGTCTLWRWTK
jgi:hypothetical protein